MSVQFGKCNFDGEPIDRNHLDEVRAVLARYAPDGEGIFHQNYVGILYGSFHTTQESRGEVQPHVCASGAVIVWDGRLDNRRELIQELKAGPSTDSTDVSIVAAAYSQWGAGSFAKLTGDWALSIWEPTTRTLLLAKDPVGTRHLYYSIEHAQITWSTVLDPLLLYAKRSFRLNEEYLAGWLFLFPAYDLTPYVGIQSVPPSCFVRVTDGIPRIIKYWDFDPKMNIRYGSDTEYEEHFRTIFAKAVQRRLRSDRSILAELSGGMDSSSIVCMADALIAGGEGGTANLHTISYYDDSEPNWNELPYVARVEAKRGRNGRHIDVSQSSLSFEVENKTVALTPASVEQPSKSWEEFVACMFTHGHRVVLSGLGGDEVTGGVPTPVPELADLLVGANLRILVHQLKVWALNKRKPWFHLLFQTARRFFPVVAIGSPYRAQSGIPWLSPGFAYRNRSALSGYACRLTLFGPRPSFQENFSTLDALRRQMSCPSLPCDPPYEMRYPYLDRDLLEFMYAIPREQLVRPGQRRSLMRRALVGIVPGEILNRRRKAYVARMPLAAISAQRAGLSEMARNMISSSCGFVDQRRLLETLQSAQRGEEVPIVPLMRTVSIELWLRNLSNRGMLQEPSAGAAGRTSRHSASTALKVQFEERQS